MGNPWYQNKQKRLCSNTENKTFFRYFLILLVKDITVLASRSPNSFSICLNTWK